MVRWVGRTMDARVVVREAARQGGETDGSALNRREVMRWLGAGLAAPGVAVAAPDTLLTPEEQAFVTKHPVLLFAPERDFPPFSFVDSQGQHRGLSADVLELMQQHTGLKF